MPPTEDAPLLRGLEIGDDSGSWRHAGFAVADGVLVAGGVACRLVGTDAGRGVLAWDLGVGLAGGDVDGLALRSTGPDHATSTPHHPNGVVALDHVVVATDDLERTTAALAGVGLRPRRTLVGAQGDDALTYRFYLLGTCVLEVIGPSVAEADATGPARFVGLAFTTTAIDDLGDLAPTPWPAVQPGRRITTLDHHALDLGVPVALLSPRPPRAASG